MRIRFRSLESRIVTLFLVLIIVVQAVSLIVIQQGIDRNARSDIKAELANGEKVFRRLLDQNAQKLLSGARLLARDTGFVASIGASTEDDRATIESALENSRRRIGASLATFVNADRKIQASTNQNQALGIEQLVLAKLDESERADGANGIAIVDQKPFQMVVIPVKAPIVIGWIVMTFPIGNTLATDMHEVSALQVSMLTSEGDKSWKGVNSTLPPAGFGSVVEQLQNLSGLPKVPFDLNVDGSKFSVLLVKLGSDGKRTANVLLARSIDEATASYDNLERLLVALTVIATIIAASISVFTAKRIAQPLGQLASTAQRLERGDYRVQIEVERGDEIGALAKAFSSMRDGIAKREQEIRHLAYWDPLTNLPNRAQFVLLLDESLAEARKQGDAVFVLMMDLDRFKHVNDVLGHKFGDQLLRKVAERLQLQIADLNSTAQVARLGGDEFAVLLSGADMLQAQVLAERILAALELPLSLEDQTVDIGAGLGIAGYPLHASDGTSLLSMAEVAMYAAKLRNDGAVVYDSRIDKGSETSLSMLTELRNAIERNEFRLHVQPKTTLRTGEVVGVEALVRWVHPERGNVFPDEFIPFAEQTGFIRVLTRWVLDQSAALCQEMISKGVHLKFSVNLSTRDLLDQDLPGKFRDILDRHQLSPQSFCLEITESTIMDDPVRAQQTLARLHAMGVDLSIDDFGTGYSSLAYLKRLPVNELKIDKSFVLNMENDVGDTKIVRSTIDLGHNMGLRVVAEGIESEAVWRLLAKMGCDQGQGYFMSRPMPGDQLLAWIAQWKPPGPATVEDPHISLAK